MTSNRIIKLVHRAAVEKAAAKCALEGGNKTAVEIGNAIIAYGKQWTEGLANDGKIDQTEVDGICDEFDKIIEAHVPSVGGWSVGIAYYGFSILGFKGIKHYLNKWFNLGLK